MMTTTTLNTTNKRQNIHSGDRERKSNRERNNNNKRARKKPRFYEIFIENYTKQYMPKKSEVKAFLDNLEVSKEERKAAIHWEQRSQVWFDAHKNRLSGSSAGSAAGNNKNCSPRELLKNMLWPNFHGNDATAYGSEMEYPAGNVFECAMVEYARKFGIPEDQCWMEEVGWFYSEKYPWIGVSPDGILHMNGEDIYMEIKAPYFKKSFYPSWPHYYYDQITLGMAVTGLKKAATITFTPTHTQIEIFTFDKAYWLNDLLPKLKNFYYRNYIPCCFAKERGILRWGEIDIIPGGNIPLNPASELFVVLTCFESKGRTLHPSQYDDDNKDEDWNRMRKSRFNVMRALQPPSPIIVSVPEYRFRNDCKDTMDSRNHCNTLCVASPSPPPPFRCRRDMDVDCRPNFNTHQLTLKSSRNSQGTLSTDNKQSDATLPNNNTVSLLGEKDEAVESIDEFGSNSNNLSHHSSITTNSSQVDDFLHLNPLYSDSGDVSRETNNDQNTSMSFNSHTSNVRQSKHTSLDQHNGVEHHVIVKNNNSDDDNSDDDDNKNIETIESSPSSSCQRKISTIKRKTPTLEPLKPTGWITTKKTTTDMLFSK